MIELFNYCLMTLNNDEEQLIFLIALRFLRITDFKNNNWYTYMY